MSTPVNIVAGADLSGKAGGSVIYWQSNLGLSFVCPGGCGAVFGANYATWGFNNDEVAPTLTAPIVCPRGDYTGALTAGVFS